MSSQTFILNNGRAMPAIGFGTWDPTHPEAAYGATRYALEVGYRHLDCASLYQNEELVGKALREFLQSHPEVSREEIFVTTKVWNHLHQPEDVAWSLDESLRNFGLEYVDLYLLHYPIASEKDDQNAQKKTANGKYAVNRQLTEHPEPTWRAMEMLVHSGKTRAIGVSNWSIGRLESLMSWASIQPSVNQIEIHPFFPNKKLVDYCLRRNVIPQAYSPLGSQVQTMPPCGRVLESEERKIIAKQSGHSVAQISLAWGLRRGYAILPKSFTRERIAENFNLPKLTDEEFLKLQNMSDGHATRFVDISAEYDYENFWDDEGDK